MSVQAIGWVLDHSEATLADRLVLLAIANHCDARGYNSYPSVDTIARHARVHRATVYRSIEVLEHLGELVVHRRPGRSSMYGLRALLEGSQPATGEGVATCDPGVASTQKRGRNLRPKPSVTVNEPTPAPVFKTPELPPDVRARGAEFFRTLRQGEHK